MYGRYGVNPRSAFRRSSASCPLTRTKQLGCSTTKGVQPWMSVSAGTHRRDFGFDGSVQSVGPTFTKAASGSMGLPQMSQMPGDPWPVTVINLRQQRRGTPTTSTISSGVRAFEPAEVEQEMAA